jgi:hypothetical protein
MASSRRSSGWWSATVLTARLQSVQIGSRVRTAALNLRCPVVPYGLPSGLRSLSACPLHLGQRPVPWCSSGQSGLVQTRHALVAIGYASVVLRYLSAFPQREPLRKYALVM